MKSEQNLEAQRRVENIVAKLAQVKGVGFRVAHGKPRNGCESCVKGALIGTGRPDTVAASDVQSSGLLLGNLN